MEKNGTVIRWDEGKAYGFIRSDDTHADVFFHLRDMQRGSGQIPAVGMAVVFQEIHVGGKGPRAVAVRPIGQSAKPMDRHRATTRQPWRESARPRHTPSSPAPATNLWVVPLAIAFAAFIGWCIWRRFLPAWVAGVLLGVNLVTFMRYWFDKYAASRRQWRTPESKLHFWSLAGGWPAAWLAQQVLRHKSSKPEFLGVYCATVFVNLAVWGGWFWWDHVRA